MKASNLRCVRPLFWIIAFSFFLTLPNPASCDSPEPREYWPTKQWKTSAPEKQGMDAAKLMIADEFVRERLPDAFSLLVVRNGYLVFEKYYSYGSIYRQSVVHSVTKSVTSALIGIALEKGYLKSLDQKLVEFFPEYITDDQDPRKKEITIEHLLTMSTGVRWDDRGPSMTDWYFSSDWVKGAIQQPQEYDPGAVFTYNSSTSHLLSAILTKSTKTSTLDFGRKYFFEPMGITSALWHTDPQGNHIGGFGLSLPARDLAKIGFLYLNNGYWDGKSIVAEDWVKESTGQQIQAYGHPVYGRFGYGYQWWVKEVDGCKSFRAWGRRGQFIVVVPELDLVIAVTSNSQLPNPPTSIHYTPLFDLVAASVTRDRPAKMTHKPAQLPEDARAFVDGFNQALKETDQVKVADSVSDRFLYSGARKQMVIRALSQSPRYMKTFKMVLTRFVPEGNIARIEGVIQDKYFEKAIFPGMMLIKENNQWKWYGNQKQRALPR